MLIIFLNNYLVYYFNIFLITDMTRPISRFGLDIDSEDPLYVPLFDTGLSEREDLSRSSHAGPVPIGNVTNNH